MPHSFHFLLIPRRRLSCLVPCFHVSPRPHLPAARRAAAQLPNPISIPGPSPALLCGIVTPKERGNRGKSDIALRPRWPFPSLPFPPLNHPSPSHHFTTLPHHTHLLPTHHSPKNSAKCSNSPAVPIPHHFPQPSSGHSSSHSHLSPPAADSYPRPHSAVYTASNRDHSHSRLGGRWNRLCGQPWSMRTMHWRARAGRRCLRALQGARCGRGRLQLRQDRQHRQRRRDRSRGWRRRWVCRLEERWISRRVRCLQGMWEQEGLVLCREQ